MKHKLYLLIQAFNREWTLLLGISIGVFLFILFFQPFPILQKELDFLLLFIAGMGGIVFIIAVSTRLIYPRILSSRFLSDTDPGISSYLNGFVIFLLDTVAFAFYLHYVGSLHITFYIVFKSALICLAPPVILVLHDKMKELRKQNESLLQEKKNTRREMALYRDNLPGRTIDFASENNTENLRLPASEVICIKSADNYVEIVFREDNRTRKKLLRNTMKNIEQLVSNHPAFIRCHRVCIVNTDYIDQLLSSYGSYSLKLKGMDETIPVSRQYLLAIRECL